MVYRPTVRYSDEFKDYVNSLFHATNLDRNQIIRAALFAAAFSPNFKALLEPYKKSDVPFPSPKWEWSEHGYWLERTPIEQKGGKDVNDILSRRIEAKRDIKQARRTGEQEEQNKCEQSIKRREREISIQPIKVRNQGGITIKIG